MMSRDLHRLRDLTGTPDFAEALAEQERALGLILPPPPTLFDSLAETAAPAQSVEPSGEPPNTADDQTSDPSRDPRDCWGNRILGAPGPLGQYRIASARNGLTARVCGEAATTRHLWAWEYDASELRYVCAICWPKAIAAQAASVSATASAHVYESNQSNEGE